LKYPGSAIFFNEASFYFPFFLLFPPIPHSPAPLQFTLPPHHRLPFQGGGGLRERGHPTFFDLSLAGRDDPRRNSWPFSCSPTVVARVVILGTAFPRRVHVQLGRFSNPSFTPPLYRLREKRGWVSPARSPFVVASTSTRPPLKRRCSLKCDFFLFLQSPAAGS